MARLSSTIVILAILLTCASFTKVQACENKCREDPVTFLVKKYNAILDFQASTLMSAQARNTSGKLKSQILAKLDGSNNVIDKTIFDKFSGHCEIPGVGLRSPDEFCGSAKSIACFTPWEHRDSVFATVHAAVVEVIKEAYADQSPEVQEVMVDGVADFCPDNCQDWVMP
ncbi:hypothetical protein BGZ94_001261 [Podila epigama]|nr:hypothetical protein BGZ94_001261 [Podila epigama]